MKRKPRNKERKNLSDEQMLQPLDITKFGGPDDPCFGKHHDLKSEDCRACGDSELCAIALSHKGLAMRQKLEMKQSFKDMEDTEIDLKEKRVRKYIAKKLGEGLPLKKVLKRASKRYELPLHRIEEINTQK